MAKTPEQKINAFTTALELPETLDALLSGPIAGVRLWLKTVGWRRTDRHNVEIWEAPYDLKWCVGGVSIQSAVKAHLRNMGYDTKGLRV